MTAKPERATMSSALVFDAASAASAASLIVESLSVVPSGWPFLIQPNGA
jgi:hypothetical protein